ncbi:CRAL-TRIO domain-containing protein [Syncephalis pseudoplumigaleata]|uniref:CRAL-TRIO domain-containing protein n=1 Tax=Syncephalis pseudoplumigaleata TaxID=1712513 RepID=A0A4P9Z657_9FUNG|nr:CRAL-TRIO domain-containing protein [Syncephalis pseudoplumigaleata]|eukprot:RKP28134.1 CRAL-TRIO domain-containing protein [Syncephalis pseudoplumigaleata]
MEQTSLFFEHKSTVRTLQRSLIQEIDTWHRTVKVVDHRRQSRPSKPDSAAAEAQEDDAPTLSPAERDVLAQTAIEYIEDAATIFRHLKTARYDVTVARQNIRETLRWRRSMSVHRPGHWLHRGLLHSGACRVIGRDPQGRQTLWLNLDALSRSEASREEVRLFTVGMLEALRLDTHVRFNKDGRLVQCVCVLDLAGVGVTSMDTELAPFVLDLLLNRFPSCFAAVYVLNYSWMYAGVWSLIKRLIPENSRGRVVFPSRSELKERLGLSQLPEDTKNYNPDTCEFLLAYRKYAAQATRKYGQPASNEEEEEMEDGDAMVDASSNDAAADEMEDAFYDAPLWSDTAMQTYADHRIALLEEQLAESQRLVRHMQRQLTQTRQAIGHRTSASRTRSMAIIYRRMPTVLYALGPQQLYALFTWWWLSARSMKKRLAQWWTRRAANRGVLYWLVALLITREGVATLFGEVLMRTLVNAVHLRGIMP